MIKIIPICIIIAFLCNKLTTTAFRMNQLLVAQRISTNFLKKISFNEGSIQNNQQIKEVEQNSTPFPRSQISELNSNPNQGIEEKQPSRSIMGKIVAWLLCRIVVGRTRYIEDLKIDVISNNRNILRGKLDAIDMKFKRIILNKLEITRGGSLKIFGLDLKMRSFLFFQNLQAIRKPYSIHAEFNLSSMDIFNSKMLKDLIQLLVNTIIKRSLGTNDLIVKVTKFYLEAKRLHIQGIAQSQGLSNILPFEVSSDLKTRNNGRIIFLKDYQVVFNPDSILRTPFPIIMSTPIDVDLGENCKVSQLKMEDNYIAIKMDTIISPVQPFVVAEPKKLALYQYDLAAFFSNFFRLPSGLAVKYWLPFNM